MESTALAGNWRYRRRTVIAVAGALMAAVLLQFSVVANQARAAAPAITVDNASVVVDEGETATNTGTFEDSNAEDPNANKVDITASIGQVTKTGDSKGTWSWSYEATEGPIENQTVTVTATRQDSGKEAESVQFSLTVNPKPPPPVDATPPEGSVFINNDAKSTRNAKVKLTLSANDPSPGSGVESMRFSNDGKTWSEWEPYATSKDWVLGKKKGKGKRTVYVEYRDQAENTSTAATDTIVLKEKR